MTTDGVASTTHKCHQVAVPESKSASSSKREVKWCPLEANPEVLRDYCGALLRRPSGDGSDETIPTEHFPLQFVDVLGTEDWALALVPQPVLALVLLFPISDTSQRVAAQTIETSNAVLAQNEVLRRLCSDDIWFTRQTVSNSCGTVALLHVLLNCVQQGLIKCPQGCVLAQFQREAESLTPEERARLLERFAALSVAHSRHSQEGASRPISADSSVNEHFVALMPFGGQLVELDGRKSRPVFVRELPAKTPEAFLQAAVAYVLESYMHANPSCMRFCLIAVSAAESG